MSVEIKERKETLEFQKDILAIWPRNKSDYPYGIYNRLVSLDKYKMWSRKENPEWRKFYSKVISTIRRLESKGELVKTKSEEGFGGIPRTLYKKTKGGS